MDMRHLLIRWPPRFLRTPEAARFLGVSTRTLEKHRCYGTGPKYRKIGGRVIYALTDLKTWADIGLKQSTSDPGVGTVSPAKPILAGGVLSSAPVASQATRTGFRFSERLGFGVCGVGGSWVSGL